MSIIYLKSNKLSHFHFTCSLSMFSLEMIKWKKSLKSIWLKSQGTKVIVSCKTLSAQLLIGSFRVAIGPNCTFLKKLKEIKRFKILLFCPFVSWIKIGLFYKNQNKIYETPKFFIYYNNLFLKIWHLFRHFPIWEFVFFPSWQPGGASSLLRICINQE